MLFHCVFCLLLFARLHSIEEWHSQKEDPFFVSIVLDKDRLMLFDTLNVTLKLNFPATYEVSPEQLKNQLLEFPPWEPGPYIKINSIKQEDGPENSQEFHFSLSPLRGGRIPLTFRSIRFMPKTGVQEESKEMLTPLFYVNVFLGSSISLPTLGVLPLKNGLPLELNSQNQQELLERESLAYRHNEAVLSEISVPWYFFLFLVMIFVGVALVAMLMLDTSTKQRTPEEIKQQAIDQVKRICSQQIPIPELYTQLSHDMRYLLKTVYRIPATVDTTEELLVEIRNMPNINPELEKKLKKLFQSIDDVIFGGHKPSKTEVSEIKELALNINQFAQETEGT